MSWIVVTCSGFITNQGGNHRIWKVLDDGWEPFPCLPVAVTRIAYAGNLTYPNEVVAETCLFSGGLEDFKGRHGGNSKFSLLHSVWCCYLRVQCCQFFVYNSMHSVRRNTPREGSRFRSTPRRRGHPVVQLVLFQYPNGFAGPTPTPPAFPSRPPTCFSIVCALSVTAALNVPHQATGH